MNRHQLGEEIAIQVQCRSASSLPSNPDAAPELRVYDQSFALIATYRLPPKDRHHATGYFEHSFRLNSDYAEGQYSWRVSYAVDSVAGVASGVFHIVPGGSAEGAVEAAEWIDKRGSSHLLQQLPESYAFGANPRL